MEYIYDLRGNQTEASNVTDGVITRNDYTVEGQLVRVSEEDANGTTVIQQNAYDAEGTRVQKTEGNDIKKYYYAGSDMVATTKNGNFVFTGICDGGEIVGAYLGATPSYSIYCIDIQGSTSVLALDISGGYSYSDYGEVTVFDGTTSQNEICYTGAVYDSTIGEHYLRARYYDPEQGVFTTQDTLRGETTDSTLWNSYAYCNGDPVNNCDPSGHMKRTVVFAYHNKGRLNRSFLDQAKHSYYYKTKNVTIYKIPTYRSLRKRWNRLKKKVKKVYIYLHGNTGCVSFPSGAYHLQSRSKGFKKKKSIKKVYFFSCHGGEGGKSSVAYFFKTKVNKKAKIYASKESVSFTKVKAWRGMSYKYAPRYSFEYAWNNGMLYYYMNPVKEIKEW